MAAGRLEHAPLPNSREERKLVALFTDAFEGGDVQGVVALLTDDAWLTVPPEPLAYHGRAAIARFLSTVPAGGRLDMFRSSPRARTASLRLLHARPMCAGRARTDSWSSRCAGAPVRLLVQRAYTDITQSELVDTYASSAFEAPGARRPSSAPWISKCFAISPTERGSSRTSRSIARRRGSAIARSMASVLIARPVFVPRRSRPDL
jgi:hypothetical protein